MAYTAFDNTKPASSQAANAVPGSANTNDIALWYDIVMGAVPGFAFSVSGGTAEEPTTIYFKNGATWIRGSITWTSGNITQITWDVSTDTGSTWIGGSGICQQQFSYDGTTGALATTTNAGGMLSMVAYLIGKMKGMKTTYDAHVAATGASVHGLGTIATQAANSVALTGGTVNGTTVGLSTAAEGLFTRACEQYNTYAPGSGAGVTVDWAKGGSSITNSGTNTLTFSNVPSSRIATHALYVTNLNNTTFPGAVNWGVNGKPSINGAALVSMATFDGGTTVLAVVAWRAV